MRCARSRGWHGREGSRRYLVDGSLRERVDESFRGKKRFNVLNRLIEHEAFTVRATHPREKFKVLCGELDSRELRLSRV